MSLELKPVLLPALHDPTPHIFSVSIAPRPLVRSSYYLLPSRIVLINIVIEDTELSHSSIDLLDENMECISREEVQGGCLKISTSRFRNGCCYFRFGNGRILGVHIDYGTR